MKLLMCMWVLMGLLVAVPASAQNYPLDAGTAYGGFRVGDGAGAHLFGSHNRGGRQAAGLIGGLLGWIGADSAQNHARHQRQNQRRRDQEREYGQEHYSQPVQRAYTYQQPEGCSHVYRRNYRDCDGNIITETTTVREYTTQTYIER